MVFMIKKQMLSYNEPLVQSSLLFTALVFLIFDMIGDFMAGTRESHIAVASIIAIALVSAFRISLKNALSDYKEQVRVAKEHAKDQKTEAERYKQLSENYLEGLGDEIERHMMAWKLTGAEREVALLLIKGLLIKEIGEIRGVKEKTIRQQSLSIYKKSGLGNRSELAAFFLEDLLGPATTRLGA